MSFILSNIDLARLMPAHLIVDNDQRVLQVGPAIARHLPDVHPTEPLAAHFVWIGFAGAPCLNQLADKAMPVQLRARHGHIVLSGSVVAGDGAFLLALHIMAADITQNDPSLQISDFALGDPSVQGMLLVNLQKAMLEEARATAIKLSEERLRTEEQLNRVTRVTAYLAHDVNNYMSIVRLNGQRILDNSLSSAQKERLVHIIIDSAERGSRATRSLLTLSNNEQEYAELLCVDDLLADHALYFSAIVGSNIDLRLDLNAPNVLVDLQKTGLTNCIVNLLLNSRDAMQSGGNIVVSTNIEDGGALTTCGAAVQKSSLTISVSDTGHGMSEQTVARVFEPFFSTKSNGNGIGLASVQEFIRNSQGQVSIYSTVDTGTDVRLSIPIKDRKSKAREPIRNEIARHLAHPTRLLIVEDEPYALEALVEIMEDEGFAVSGFTSGHDAMCAMEQGINGGLPHQIMLADVAMPGISGIELAHHAENKIAGIKIVLMSGYRPSLEEIEPRWVYISKPIDSEELINELRAIEREKSGKLSAFSYFFL